MGKKHSLKVTNGSNTNDMSRHAVNDGNPYCVPCVGLQYAATDMSRHATEKAATSDESGGERNRGRRQ